MTLPLKAHRSRQVMMVFIWLVVLLIVLRTPTTPVATSAEVQPQQRQQRRQYAGWTSTAAPRRRQPLPLDCFVGLQRCREDTNCRTLLDTLDSVCDQSSTSPYQINQSINQLVTRSHFIEAKLLYIHT